MRHDDAATAAGDTRYMARKAHNEAVVSQWKKSLEVLEWCVQWKGKTVNSLKDQIIESSKKKRELVRQG